jgi:predicted amidophosphoribosyltransferase
LDFPEHLRKREENPSLAPCARCGKLILATTTRCPECGVHFQGEAGDFTHPFQRDASGRRLPMWVVVAAVLLIIAVVAGALVGR